MRVVTVHSHDKGAISDRRPDLTLATLQEALKQAGWTRRLSGYSWTKDEIDISLNIEDVETLPWTGSIRGPEG